jgi:hypothetical protein
MNQVIYKMIDDMKQQVVEFISNQVLIPQKIWFSVISISGPHFSKEDNATSDIVCILEIDGLREHAIEIWQGKIYNLYQEYVWEQSDAEFYAICA